MKQPDPDNASHVQASAPPKSHRNRWLGLIALVLAVVLFSLSLRGIDWGAFWDIIRQGNYWILFIIMPLASLNYFIRSLRWNILLGAEKKLAPTTVFWANMTGYLGNAYLPARAGELLRSAYLGKIGGVGMAYVLATALTERILDAVVLILVGSLSLLWKSELSPLLSTSLKIVAMIGLAGLLVIIIAPFQEQRIVTFLKKLPFPQRILEKLIRVTARFLHGMRSLQSWRRASAFLGMTAVIWFLDAAGASIGVRIISQDLPIWQALILLSALGLSSAMPSTPGYIGIYQFVAVTVLVPLGFSQSSALAFILISQILNYLVVSFWGLIGLWKLNHNAGTTLE